MSESSACAILQPLHFPALAIRLADEPVRFLDVGHLQARPYPTRASSCGNRVARQPSSTDSVSGPE